MPLMPNMNTYATNRLLIYLGISILTAISSELQLVAAGKKTWNSWVEVVLSLIAIFLPPLIVLRAFMDQSLGKSLDKTKD